MKGFKSMSFCRRNPWRLVVSAVFCVLFGAATTEALEMQFFPVEGKEKGWQLVCKDLPAYDALVAIAKRKGYEIVFDEKAEAICRSVKLTGIFEPWDAVEVYILQLISAKAKLPEAEAHLPFGHFVEMKRSKNPKAGVRVIIVDKTGGRPVTPPRFGEIGGSQQISTGKNDREAVSEKWPATADFP